jgi:tripartite-type tricarboxylate transporter receptor subunit TctC
MPNIKQQMQKAEIDSLSSTSEQFSEFMKAETVRWAKVIKEASISLD